ncbi:Tripartite motif-containing protein 65 [Liparis tanakae]|uniref:Tripartite motif-containing protein 65 n=1 Tax=Liparis tanakae TaxID=230148 RepID=A0A4Z2I905_9TELE|nr:Tripartite motif-containing protein 65 [Liparis tanakae]
MAAASNLLSEDQFLCSVCLYVFTDPVTTPCGHNFCKKWVYQWEGLIRGPQVALTVAVRHAKSRCRAEGNRPSVPYK